VDAPVRREDAGVADEHVDTAEALHGAVEHGLHLGFVGDVGEHRLDGSGMVGEAGHRGIERCLAEVAEDEIGVRLARHLARDRRAERATGAVDDDDAPRGCGCCGHTSRYPPSTLSTVP
jgi:hypothetical protein